MKKSKYIFMGLIILAIALFLYLMPRHIVKEGYIYRTMEDVRYVDNITKVSDNNYLPASGSKPISIRFNDANSDLYNLLSSTTTMSVKFDGKYYPLSIRKYGRLRIEPKILLENLISSEILGQ